MVKVLIVCVCVLGESGGVKFSLLGVWWLLVYLLMFHCTFLKQIPPSLLYSLTCNSHNKSSKMTWSEESTFFYSCVILLLSSRTLLSHVEVSPPHYTSLLFRHETETADSHNPIIPAEFVPQNINKHLIRFMLGLKNKVKASCSKGLQSKW